MPAREPSPTPELSRPLVAVVLLVLIAIEGAFLAPLFATGEPAGADLSIHFAEISHLSRALAAGDFDLWNPSANLGFASAYYYQVLPQLTVAVLHLALGSSNLVSLLFLYKLAIAAPLILLPLTCYRALRVSGLAAAPALGGAAAAGFVFGPSPWGIGADAIFTAGLFTQPWALLFFPLALAYATRYLADADYLGRAVVYTLLTGLCHPFFAVALLPALGVAAWWRNGTAPAAVRAALLLALVLAVSAFMWLPILVHYDSFGGFPLRRAGEAGMRPGELIGVLLRGELLDWSRPSLLSLLLIAAPWVAWRHRVHLITILLAQALLFACLLLLGPELGGGDTHLLPAIRFLAPLQLGLALVAGTTAVYLVLDCWSMISRRLAARPRRRIVARGAVIASAGAASLLLVSGGYYEMRNRTFTVADRAGVARADLDQVIDYLDHAPDGRLLAGNDVGTGSHFLMYLPAAYTDSPALRAYGGAALQSSGNFEYLDHFDLLRHHRMYNARYLIADRRARVGFGRAVLETERYQLIELPVSGYFQPVELVGTIPSGRRARRRATLAWLDSSEPQLRRHLIVGEHPTTSSGLRGHVLAEWRGPSHYSADVQVAGDQSGAFLLSVTFHPGWRGTIDGQRAEILRVTPDLMAVEVPPGKHHVSFSFERPWWSWLLMIVAALTLTGIGLRRRIAALLRRLALT